MQTKALFLFLFLMLINFAQASTVAPPDTTTNLTDRAAALLIIDEGRTMFEQGKVRDALIRFRQAAVKDPNTWKAPYWIAQCHYTMNSFGYALQYGNQAVSMGKDDVNKEIHELLGKAYHRTAVLDSALINYELALNSLSKQRVKDLQIELRIEQVKFAQAQIASGVPSKKTAFSSDVNSGYNDYTPILAAGGKELYFASRRSDTKGGNMNPDDQEFFEDVYKALWNAETSTWDSVTNDLGRINSDGFDAISYISPNGINGLMTINLTATSAKKSTKGSDIFEIEFSNKGLWSTPKRISNKTINTSFFEGSATMTTDMNTMYFVSDRKGEKSSTDIYVVERNGKKWGEAKPLPMDKINTIGRETTPYITGDGRFLFFSSDGLNGMGGLDVYVVENLGGGIWGTPVNLGIAVNSVSNDSHFQYYPELKKAVMVTFEIVGQKASLDMYEVEMSNFTYPTGK
jgi:tetratricopeptide (TPR) repeat protein